ncbi:MAG: hypothetical protein V4819_06765 [Verrucomicrobiota bacterium]
MKATGTPALMGFVAAGLGILLLAFWGGQSQGRAAGEKQARADAMKLTSTRSGMKGSRSRDGKSAALTKSSVSSRDAAARLKALWAASVNPAADFELFAKMEDLVDKMSSQEIAEFLGTVPPSQFFMRMNIVCYWAQRDGPAALDFLGTNSIDRMIETNAFGGWIAEDPDAALAWVRENRLPLERKVLLQNGLMALAETHPERAFQELAHVDASEGQVLLSYWVGLNPGEEVMRHRILAAAAATERPEDLAAVRKALVREWSTKDPAATAEFIASLELSGPETREIEAALVNAQAGVGPETVMEPQAALESWLGRFADAVTIPEEIKDTVGAWSVRKPDVARKWLETLPDGQQREALCDGGIRELMGNDRYAEAAKFANLLETPALRRDAFRKVSNYWSLANPEEAAKWKSSLPAEDRARIGAE